MTNFDKIEDHDRRSISREQSVEMAGGGGIIRIDNRNYFMFEQVKVEKALLHLLSIGGLGFRFVVS